MGQGNSKTLEKEWLSNGFLWLALPPTPPSKPPPTKKKTPPLQHALLRRRTDLPQLPQHSPGRCHVHGHVGRLGRRPAARGQGRVAGRNGEEGREEPSGKPHEGFNGGQAEFVVVSRFFLRKSQLCYFVGRL